MATCVPASWSVRPFWRVGAFSILAVVTAIASASISFEPPAPGGPTLSVRNAHSMVYDSSQRTVFLFGGADANHVCEDTWHWDREKRAWAFVARDGPGPRTFAAFAYDERRGEAILFGGNRVLFGKGDETDTFLADTWRLRNYHWTPSRENGPAPRAEASIAYDRDRGRIVLFGGYNRKAGATQRFGDTWEWDGEHWSKVSVEGPTPRNNAAMIYDEQRHRIVLFGGPGPSNETWQWDGHIWTRLQAGDVPGRFNPVVAYDSGRKEVLRFGGWTGKERVGDTWILNSAGWSQLDVAGPSPRNHSAMAYDRQRRRALLFGGHDGDTVFGDTWEWDGSTWSRVAYVAPERRADNGH